MRPSLLLLTAFGLGLMRPASGTWGSTLAPGVVLGLILLLGRGELTPCDHLIINGVLVLLMLVFSCACVAFGKVAEAKWGKKDPGQVVADEVAGQSLALLALPWVGATHGAGWLVVNITMLGIGFLTFRALDIIKPPPARHMERLPAGWGILVDDLVAGAYALVVTQILVRLGLGW